MFRLKNLYIIFDKNYNNKYSNILNQYIKDGRKLLEYKVLKEEYKEEYKYNYDDQIINSITYFFYKEYKMKSEI